MEKDFELVIGTPFSRGDTVVGFIDQPVKELKQENNKVIVVACKPEEAQYYGVYSIVAPDGDHSKRENRWIADFKDKEMARRLCTLLLHVWSKG